MNANKISAEEIEALSGVDVSEIFVGGIFGGVYRPSVFRHPHRLLGLGLTQLLVIALMFALMLPIALFLSGSASSGIRDLSSTVRFLQIAIALTGLGAIVWNVYMRFAMRRFKVLMALLDDVDRYNQVTQAMHVLSQLEGIQGESDRTEVLEAIGVTRENLVSGLMIEKILRENRDLMNRYALASIEQNLVALETLEMHHQASEHSRILRETLQISVSVHRELQRISPPVR
jgi:hypothetical protein